MKKFKIIILLGVLLLSLSLTGVVSAQDELPEEEPLPTGTYTHPIVELLATYFSQTEDTGTEPDADPDQDADPGDDIDLGEDAQAALEAEIQNYFEEGLGFGVLVKLYAIADESEQACAAEAEEAGTETPDETCGVTVEELVELFEGGTGMGQIFQIYGRPSMLGVGHVRQVMGTSQDTTQATSGEDGGGSGQQGICNARSHGGKANANGQNVNCD